MRIERVTVFGGSGFIGRHLVQRLAHRGMQVVVAVRDPEGASFLKPLGDVGQIVPVRADVRDDAAVAAAVRGAGAVVNLVGILHERGRQTFAAIHAEAPGRVAAAARAAGVRRFVQMSALGADPRSPSDYARSKAAGEAAAREAFPEAVIARPSVVFGPEDGFFNRFGLMARLSPVLPVIGATPRLVREPGAPPRLDLFGDGGPRFQPVFVGDVAEVLLRAVEGDVEPGSVWSLGGPTVYTFKELMELVCAETHRRRLLVPVPYWLASLEAAWLQFLPDPPLTPDQVRLLRRDNVVAEDGTRTFADLGIEPTDAEVVLPTYMDKYRPKGRFARPRFA